MTTFKVGDRVWVAIDSSWLDIHATGVIAEIHEEVTLYPYDILLDKKIPGLGRKLVASKEELSLYVS